MSELGGLRKHEKTRHSLVGLGSAALAAAVALRPGQAANISHKGLIKCNILIIKKNIYKNVILQACVVTNIFFLKGGEMEALTLV